MFKEDVMLTTQRKPEVPFIMSLIGGIFILVDGALGFMMAVRFGSWPIWIWDFQYSEYVLGSAGVTLGILIILLAVWAYKKAERKTPAGVIIVVASILSFFIMMGGYVVGFAFGLIGGILYLVWEPAETKNCLRCGREIKLESWYCPHCGYMYVQPYYYPGQTYSHQYQQGRQQSPEQSQPATTTGQKLCTKCGAGIGEGSIFCSSCGQRA
jgi:heme A synthase